MGGTLSCLGHTSPKRVKTLDSDERHVGLQASIMELIRPRRLGTMAKQKEEKQQQPLTKNTSRHQLTLQEWILASPSLNNKQSSKKVHPSLDETHEGFIYNLPRDGFSMESVMKVGKVDREDDSSLSRSQSGKTKKVSFRLPVVSDVFILY